VEKFAASYHRNYYGKADVIVYRLNREAGQVFGANVTMLLYGDAFWPTYTTGDNTQLIATDSMKNFIQREALNFTGAGLEAFCRFLAEKFFAKYSQTEGILVKATEIPYAGSVAFIPGGPDRAFASIEINRSGVVEERSGIHGFRLLRLGGSAFTGFVRDEYTTLPEITNRPLHMWLDLEWLCSDRAVLTREVREIVLGVFHSFESGSIQQVIYQIGTKMLGELPAVTEVRLEANNRTWDQIAVQGETTAVYTDPRPPYGVLGLTLRR
jgi:urate oxidase/2-oxo-4-hydroxy-4-carboxy-5-ureidoimidazoline decarboxylase